jgi:Bifunctional DNA primase/polymerase, N-terminal/Family of unknown function (DUF5906)
MPSNPNYDCAVRLATAGLAVFPLRAHDRHPLVAWSSESTIDTATVTHWWQLYPQALPGLDLAKCSLVVLDGDRHKPQVDGVAELRQLLKQQSALQLSAVPTVRTPRDGVHTYFAQVAPPLANRRGQLPAGIDVKGSGGFVVAPGAVLPDGRCYAPLAGTPDLVLAFTAKTIPVVPAAIVALVDPPRRRAKAQTQHRGPPRPRERAYAKAALRRIAGELAATAPGKRNETLNKAAFVLGTMVARDWVTRDEVEDALRAAMEGNGYAADKGSRAVDATLKSGLEAGMDDPHDDLPEQGVVLEDFVSHAPSRMYFFLPCREPWPGASVNSRLPKIEVTTAAGELKEVAPTSWLDLHRSVEQMTWCPDEPMLIRDRLFIPAGGWVVRPGVMSLNHYRPPSLERGDADEATRWIEHVHRLYSKDDAHHIIRWLAHRVQRPAEKINHALVLGGLQGIGKDTLLEPAIHAVGPWNVQDISPSALLGSFNSYLKSVILRVSEAHDLGDTNRFALYERLKAYTAAPPDALRVNEKHLREYAIPNCVGVLITTNHRSDGMFLVEDDRRHYVAWSNRTKEDFEPEYWRGIWGWYDAGGLGHVAAYLRELDLSDFDPKAPPPKTAAFWEMVETGRAPEDAEIADALDELGTPDPGPPGQIQLPDAITLEQIRGKAGPGLDEWLTDRKNRRVIPHRLYACGYVPVRNPDRQDGLWRLKGTRQVIYAKAALSPGQQMQAARAAAGQ